MGELCACNTLSLGGIMGEFSIWHMVILFVIVLIIFGPKNLPKVGQALGKGIREFKDAARGITSELEQDQRPSPPPRETPHQDASAEPPSSHSDGSESPKV
jgi:sec-independent protein translocase protein TatA